MGAASRRQSSTTMLALLILGAVASAQKDDFGFGGAPRRPPPPPADKPKPLWFVPSGAATKGVSYNSKSCSEGCCFYTPASSKRVQEIEAEVEKNLPTWFRTPAGGCDAVPSSTYNSRLVLNKDNNDSGNEAALCVKSKDSDTFELLTGETTSCKGKCCVFQCKSCKAPES